MAKSGIRLKRLHKSINKTDDREKYGTINNRFE